MYNHYYDSYDTNPENNRPKATGPQPDNNQEVFRWHSYYAPQHTPHTAPVNGNVNGNVNNNANSNVNDTSAPAPAAPSTTAFAIASVFPLPLQ